MALPLIQTSFAAGELAPSLWGHVDFAKFAIGAATMRNFFVSYRGGAYSRAGTAFVGFSKQTQGSNATGSLTFGLNPSDGDTITLNGTVITFSAAPVGHYQCGIGGNLATTLSLLLNNCLPPFQNQGDPTLNVAGYAITSTQLLITYKTTGPGGNAYTLAASAATRSGATLTGGVNGRTNPPRLIPFQFSLNQGLMLEFGHLYMRVIQNGAFVTETAKVISGATQANPCVITTSTAHGYANGDSAFIAGVVGMVQLNGRTFVVQVLTATTFALYDVYGNSINSSGYVAYGSGGTSARIYTLTTPYADTDLPYLKYAQSADVMSLTCVNQETGTAYPPYDLSRIANNNWSLALLSTGSSIVAPTAMAATASTSGYVAVDYCATAIDPVTGDESIASNIATVTHGVDFQTTAGSISMTWGAVASASYYNVYRSPLSRGSAGGTEPSVPAGSLFFYVGTSYSNSFVDSNIVADASKVPPLHKNPFAAGTITGATVTAGGSGYVTPDYVITTASGAGTAGSGAVLLIIQSGGVVQNVQTLSGGAGYGGTDKIVIYDSSGSLASGSIVFGGNPAINDTITLNGSTITFTNIVTNTHKCLIGATLADTLTNLLDGCLPPFANNGDSGLNVATYTVDGTHVYVTYKFGGTDGNAYTLAASVATPSGATLSGGTGGGGATATLAVGSGNYPGVVSYFQERRVYASTPTDPDTYWMSQPGSFRNFDSRIPTIDSDAIVGTPWSVQVDGIQWLLPLLGGMVGLTGHAAYLVVGTGGSPTSPQPITPSSQQALPQVFNGAHSHVPPVLIDYDINYLQAKGSVIRSLSYNFWLNVMTGIDITYLSSHLFTGFDIDAMAWAEEPYKIMWCVRSDGAMLSLTSLKSQDVMAWARHDTNGLFCSAAVVTEPPIDAMYVATQRYPQAGLTPFMIERMDGRIWNTVEDVWAVDCGLRYPQPAPTAVILPVTPGGLGQPVGFTSLVGGANYSVATTVSISDPTGTGCVVTPTIDAVSGAITNLSFSGGSGYTNPILQIVDPNNLGSGASAYLTLDNTCIVAADRNVFANGDVGKVIRCGGGVLQITGFTSATQVTCQVCSPIVGVIPNNPTHSRYFQPGQWTMTLPTTTVTGLDHLNGMVVTGLADGNVLAALAVANGSVTLPFAASAITLGLAYQCQLQSLYLESGQPTEQGRRKKIGAVTVRMEASGNVKVGTNQQDGSAMSPPQLAPIWPASGLTGAASGTALGPVPFGANTTILGTTVTRAPALLTGDARVPVASSFQKPGQVAVQQDNPLPISVLAFIREYEPGDTPEMTPRPQGRQAQGGGR